MLVEGSKVLGLGADDSLRRRAFPSARFSEKWGYQCFLCSFE